MDLISGWVCTYERVYTLPVIHMGKHIGWDFARVAAPNSQF